MAKKKRPPARPKNVQKTIPKTINFAEASVLVLGSLSDRFRRDAPPYIRLSDRDVIEALIHYADREQLSFADLFQVPQEAEAK